MNTKIKVGIFLFNEVEVLDFAGPFEVFSLAEKDGEKIFDVITIGEHQHTISARNGLIVQPNTTFENCPKLDILIIPGGYGAEKIEINNPKTLQWIKEQYTKVDLLTSVCTGAFLLAECRLLDNKEATTHWMDLDFLEKTYPEVKVQRDVKFVEDGDIISSGGISAGIHMSFHIVKKLFGREIAAQTAKRMEYDIKL